MKHIQVVTDNANNKLCMSYIHINKANTKLLHVIYTLIKLTINLHVIHTVMVASY